MASAIDRPPHYNTEAEEALIGSLLLDPDALPRVSAILADSTDFYREKHQWMYEGMLELARSDTPCDPVTLVDRLALDGYLSQVGGPAAISAILLRVPTAIHVEYYAEIVARNATLRRLVGAAERIAKIAYEETDKDAAEILALADMELASVQRVQGAGSMVPLGKAAEGSTERLRTMREKGQAGLPVSLPSLRRVMGGNWRRKEMTVIAAYTSIGKTAFCVNESLALAKAGYSGIFFSLEQSQEALAARFQANIQNLDSSQIRNGIHDFDLDCDEMGRPLYPLRVGSWDELEERCAMADEDLARLRGRVEIDETPGYRARDIYQRAKSYMVRRPLDFVVVDYLTLLKMDKANDTAMRSVVVGDACRELREMAKKLDIHVFLLHQLGRDASEKAPTLAMLAQSIDISRHTDGALLLDEPAVRGVEGARPGDIEIRVAKNRDSTKELVDDIRTDRASGRFRCMTTERQEEDSERYGYDRHNAHGNGHARGDIAF